MNKEEQFLMIVQCGIVAYVKDMDHEIAPDVAMSMMGKAIEVAARLPAELSAIEAAAQFNQYTRISAGLGDRKPDWLR
jgi:hypothetical protein